MHENKNAMRKSLTWAGIAYSVFVAISLLGPIILDRYWNRPGQ